MCRSALLTPLLALVLTGAVPGDAPRPIKILFLGDKGHHQPLERYRQLQPVMAERGIDITYTESAAALNPKTLARYDGLLIYANTTEITPEQEKALLDYVGSGKGLIPVHCASYCFLNSPRYIALVGAQFQKHGTGTFRPVMAEPDHPVMKGFGGFESWDETYVHTRHNKENRVVLEYRQDGKAREPWTWVRTDGKGRVFYTAWGHDERTWGHPGFQNLLERGIRWAVGADPAVVPAYTDEPDMTTVPRGLPPFEYEKAKVPFYPAGEKWGTLGEPLTKMQMPLSPAESMKHMVHPVDFELQLFAAEPQIKRPICLNWDERGRLWIAESVDYPNEKQPPGQGRDRIVILEDTNHDGRADKFTVFADKLSLPTSLIFVRGGVLVHQPPDTLFLRDTDGDDVADEKQVLITGWSVGDTHAGPSNLHYGLDNWLYGIVGYAGFEGSIGGERQAFRTGFYRLKPDGSRLEFLRNTNNNSWGVGLSEEGLLFGSTANGNPSEYMPIANRYYEQVRGWSSRVLGGIAGNAAMHPITKNVRQVDWHGHFTAAAGHALYTARTYPREYWNSTAFVSEPTGHLTATFRLRPRGSDFVAHNAWNLLASEDEWTAPIVAEVGPDGCVWIIDWYNYIVQHNPTPAGFKTGKGNAYETPLRDKTHGRIYRLVPKKGKLPPALSLRDATPEKLVAALKNDNKFWRDHAQRLLVERGKTDVVPALLDLAANPDVDAIGLNPAAMHALWTLHGLGVLDGKHAGASTAVASALRHKSAGVRRNALLVLPRNESSLKTILAANRLDDDDAQVRLAAFLTLAEMPASAEAGAAVAKALQRQNNVTDRWLPDAITSAAAKHDLAFLLALASGQNSLPPRALEVAGVVAEHYARGGPASSVPQLLTLLKDVQPPLTEILLERLVKGWPKGRPVALTPDQERALQGLFTQLGTNSRGQLLQLAKVWGNRSFEKYAGQISETLLAAVRDDQKDDRTRIEAARQLLELSSQPDTLEQVLALVSPRLSPALAGGLIEAVGATAAKQTGALLVKHMAQWPPTARSTAIRLLLSRPATTDALLRAIEQHQVQLGELTLDQKQGLLAHPEKSLAARAKTLLQRGAGLPNPDRQKVVEQMLALTRKPGDPKLGKHVFQKNCATCHTHSGEGAKIGPDLTGMAAHPKEELLVHIFDPSRSVEGNFRIFTLTLTDGRVVSGLLASETKTAVELIDAQAQKHIILRDDIDELIPSAKSLMPEGFEKQLSETDIVNLVSFLTQRGQFLPLPLSKAATIVSTEGMFYSKDAGAERLIFSDWSPKMFKGVPFHLIDPQHGRVPNVILLYGPEGTFPPRMPKSVSLPCNSPAKAIHLLSGVSGWGYPLGEKGSLTMIVRLHYADGKTEDHELRNGEHFADYIRRVDVPGSEFAFALRGQQLRYLAILPERSDTIRSIEFVKGRDRTAPVIMAVTVETRP